MKIGIGDMTNLNGQLSLFLTAENCDDQMAISMLRRKLRPVDLAARLLDPKGTGVGGNHPGLRKFFLNSRRK